MNNQLVNLVNCVMYDRPAEFQVILEQLKTDIVKVKLGREQKNLIAFIAEQNKLLFLPLLRSFAWKTRAAINTNFGT